MVRVRQASFPWSLALMSLCKLALRTHPFGIVAVVMIASYAMTTVRPGRLRPRSPRLV